MTIWLKYYVISVITKSECTQLNTDYNHILHIWNEQNMCAGKTERWKNQPMCDDIKRTIELEVTSEL